MTLQGMFLASQAPPLKLELQCTASQRTTLWASCFSQCMVSCLFPGTATIFPFSLSYLFRLMRPALGSEALWETGRADCEGAQRQAGPVSHGGAFVPSDVSRPFPRGSRAARPASVNTGLSVSLPVTSLLSPPHGCREDGCWCVWVCVCRPCADSGCNINHCWLNKSSVWSCVCWGL